MLALVQDASEAQVSQSLPLLSPRPCVPLEVLEVVFVRLDSQSHGVITYRPYMHTHDTN